MDERLEQVEESGPDIDLCVIMLQIARLYEHPEEAFEVLVDHVAKLEKSLTPLDDETIDDLKHIMAWIYANPGLQVDIKSYSKEVNNNAAQLKSKKLQLSTFLIELLEDEKIMHKRRMASKTRLSTGLLRHHLEQFTDLENTNPEFPELIPEPRFNLDQHLTEVIRTSFKIKLAQVLFFGKRN